MGIDARMFVKVGRGTYDDRELMLLAEGMVCAFWSDPFFWRNKPGEKYGPRLPLSLVDRSEGYYQDGPTLEIPESEDWIKVSLGGRYYGAGYERGDILSYIAIAEWLERHTGGEVWYGGDSSGVCATLFGPAERQVLREHFMQFGHEPYVGFFIRATDGRCPECGSTLQSNGGSSTWDSVYCLLGGHRFRKHHGGDLVRDEPAEARGY